VNFFLTVATGHVKSIFLIGELAEEGYVQQPPGFVFLNSGERLGSVEGWNSMQLRMSHAYICFSS
jgi:hypothetical protein